MKFKSLAVLILFQFGLLFSNAQDKVFMLNGKIIEGKVNDTVGSQVNITLTKKQGKVYHTYLENYRVFSIVYQDGKEAILYKQDSTIGNFLETNDMRNYMVGEHDAYTNYKPVGTMVIGTTLGIGLGIFDTYSFGDPNDTTIAKGFFKSSPGFITLIFPFIYTSLAGIAPRPQLDIRDVKDKSFLNSEHYVQGFARVARYKRTIRALVFSAAGSLIGLGSYYIFK